MKVSVKIELPGSIKYSWIHQVCRTDPKWETILKDYNGILGNITAYIL
jgi:hypothetical protein